jgi:glycosyltransferase involved in cell wall biosynthesis
MELIFVEGGSSDGTYSVIEEQMQSFAKFPVSLYRQPGKGKGDSVRTGFAKAKNDVLIILDADLTVLPEDLPKFYTALVSGKGEFVNGVRLVYPMEEKAMRFFNLLGNKFFSWGFSFVLGQSIKDTLCGTKVLYRSDYEKIAKDRGYFGDFDPYGDFDLLFGATRQNLKIIDMPVRYQARVYGETNINRWQGGWLLLKMLVVAIRKIKFV